MGRDWVAGVGPPLKGWAHENPGSWLVGSPPREDKTRTISRNPEEGPHRRPPMRDPDVRPPASRAEK